MTTLENGFHQEGQSRNSENSEKESGQERGSFFLSGSSGLDPFFLQQLQDLEIYDDDVWLITIPKSGTHWLQETLCCLLHGMDFEKLKSPSYKRAYNVEFPGMQEFNRIVRDINDVKEFSAALETPRVMKTHLRWEQLPKKLRDPNCKAKIVYLSRNPKEVCISYFHFIQMIPTDRVLEEETKTLELFAEKFLEGSLLFLPYWSHVLSYWNMSRDNPKILFVKYEEMKANFPNLLDKLQEFLGLKPLTEEQKKAVTDNLRFENMKANDALMDFMLLRGKVYRKTYVNTGEEANFMRRGVSGGWKQEMPPDMIQRFDEWILKNTEDTGYSVDLDAE